MEELTASRIDRLGDRLRKADRPSSADAALYHHYRERFRGALDDVMRRLAQVLPSYPPSERHKTLDSVVAKLQRHKTRLSTMQDVAGCRIVVPGLAEQNDAVARIQAAFDARRTDDLRPRPHAGYRAVHVIVIAANTRLVEIQVRTQLQDV